MLLLSLAVLTFGDTDVSIPYTKVTLSNGLDVVVHEDHGDPVVSVYVLYHVGSAREEKGRSGFAHLFEHMLFQGSEHVGDDQHFKMISEAGGTLNGTTNVDRTVYFETLPSNQLELALWLEADRMGFLLPAMTQKKLDNQIDVVKNERRQNYENRPYGQAAGAIASALYPEGHPYSWLTIGSHEDLSRASLDDVKSFFSRWYGPNNATLAIGGDVTVAEAMRLAEKYFGGLPRGPRVDRPAPWPTTLAATKRVTIEDKVKLPELHVEWPTVPAGHPDEPALNFLAALLSGNDSARLTKALTIDEELASQVRASSDCSELAGTFAVTLRAAPQKQLDVLENRLHSILDQMSERGIDATELEGAKNRYEFDFVRRLETVASRTSMLATQNAFHNDPSWYKEDLRRNRAVTAADVKRVMERYLIGQPFVAVSVVPDGKKDLAASEKRIPLATKVGPDTDRTKRPAAAAAPDFHSPEIWRDKLANGASLSGHQTHQLPLGTLLIGVPAGRRYEDARTAGLSRLTADVLSQGTQDLTSSELASALEHLGADLSITSSDDEILFRVSCLDKNLPTAAGLLFDCLTKPRLDARDFERVKKEHLTAIETRGDRIREIAGDVFARLVRGADSALGRPAGGTASSVKVLTLDDVRSFASTHVVPGGARIAYVGSMDPTSIKQLVGPLETRWPTRSAPSVADSPAPAIGATRIYVVDKPGASQSEIRIGHMGPNSRDKDFYALSFVNYALGGAFSSRINMNLREDKGYTYGARTAIEGGMAPGAIVASGAVKADVTAESVREFMKELKGIETGLKPDEIEFTKSALQQGALRQYEASMTKLEILERTFKFGYPDDYPALRLKELAGFDKSRLDDVAHRWIHSDNMVILVVGDKTRFFDKLEGLGFGKPIELSLDGDPAVAVPASAPTRGK